MAQSRDQQKQFQERVVHIARVAKVVKGGRRFSFSALVCVGDHKSQVGFGVGKANEVPDAIRKASDVSHKNLVHIPITKESTIPFAVVGKSGSTRVLMYPAPAGKGIIAGSAARMIFDLCGIKDIVCKIHGSRNHHNVVRATFQGLSQLISIEDYAQLRGRDPHDVLQQSSSRSSQSTHSKTQEPLSSDHSANDSSANTVSSPEDKKDQTHHQPSGDSQTESSKSETKAQAHSDAGSDGQDKENESGADSQKSEDNASHADRAENNGEPENLSESEDKESSS